MCKHGLHTSNLMIDLIVELLRRKKYINIHEEKKQYKYIYIYINSQNSEKIQLNFNWILNFALRVV